MREVLINEQTERVVDLLSADDESSITIMSIDQAEELYQTAL